MEQTVYIRAIDPSVPPQQGCKVWGTDAKPGEPILVIRVS